jgi:sugar phosphate isomerase/epimerase
MKQQSRRDFLKSAAMAATVLAASSTLAEPKPHQLGIQLYTVREIMAKDFNQGLRDVASAGFQEVEAAGYYDRPAARFKIAVEIEGLRCVSAHHSLADLLAKQDELIQYAHDLGLEFLICAAPRARDASRKELTLDDWKWNFEQFNRIGEKTKAAGIQFGYHNHTEEFKRLDGVLVYDALLRHTDPHLVTMEMDCGWVFAAGFKPVDYLKRYPQRFTLLHVKDMVAKPGSEPHSPEFQSTELGRGEINYAPIFAAATHMQHYFYEQEEFDMDPVKAMKISAAYLEKLNP